MRTFATFFTLLILPFQFLIGQSNACLESQEFRIVILGSSTAAGAGVSISDSAWVNRYRNYVQGINPNNEVINLAQGGFKTYNVMPTGFIPPLGRPMPNTSKNITMALNLNPDAIIVNLPSNDNSSGYSVAEQLFNLDSLYALSNLNNVPIWICTTQPVNYNSAAQRQIQEDLKDSIELKYGMFSINFWDTIALPNNRIDSVYNTDGTHVNDAAHAIFERRVIDENILQYLYSSVTYTDFWAKLVQVELPNLCGDTFSNFKIIVANVGVVNSNPTTVYFTIENTTLGTVITDSLIVSPSIIPCEFDTVSFVSSTAIAGDYLVTGMIRNANDTNLSNDTAHFSFSTIGYPTISVINDTLCSSGTAKLEAVFEQGDTTFWYQNIFDTQYISTGTNFQTPYLTNTNSWYAEAVRGNLYYSNTMLTSVSSSVNWNGTMFDLVGNENIIIDSFDVKIASLGAQIVEIFYKSGSYLGAELDATSWTFLGFKSVNVLSVNDFINIKLGNLSLNVGDTMGIYIQLANPSSNLSYSWVANPVTRTNNELTILTGSGISHNYSNAYYPRDWSGQVYYHFGSRPNGECKTSRVKATAFVSQTNFSIGPDTILDIADSILLNGPSGMNSYLWFDGSTSQNLQVVANNLGMGIHYVNLEVEDSLKCKVTDELVLAIADLVSVNEIGVKTIKVYPNPAQNFLVLDAEQVGLVRIIATNGVVVHQSTGNGRIDISQLKSGLFILKVIISGEEFIAKFVKE